MNQLKPLIWPGVWQSLNTTEAGKEAIVHKNGARTTVSKNGDRTYHCTCGATFTRAYGFRNEEAADWVITHTDHLPPEERVDVSP